MERQVSFEPAPAFRCCSARARSGGGPRVLLLMATDPREWHWPSTGVRNRACLLTRQPRERGVLGVTALSAGVSAASLAGSAVRMRPLAEKSGPATRGAVPLSLLCQPARRPRERGPCREPSTACLCPWFHGLPLPGPVFLGVLCPNWWVSTLTAHSVHLGSFWKRAVRAPGTGICQKLPR